MAQPLLISSVGLVETQENMLKNTAICNYYSAKFWQMIRKETLRQASNPDGSIVFSSDMFKRLYNTCRVPGEVKDEVHEYFKTEAEGDCPATGIIIGRGRIFCYDFVVDGEVLTPQEFLHVFTIARDIIHNETVRPGVPILTQDGRTNWAKNRVHLKELSPTNAELLKIVESAAICNSFDDCEPHDESELAQNTLGGDLNTRWVDKTSIMVSFKNGRIGLIGEHSAYDGSISIAFSTFLMLSMVEESPPDWDVMPKHRVIPKELKFELDDHLLEEISRMEEYAVGVKNTVTAQCREYPGFGKEFMKKQKVHPDAFVQMALQWTYYKMHKSLAPTYETATMRVFHHGRTETVRSCSIEVKEWIDKMNDPSVSVKNLKTFRWNFITNFVYF